MFSIAKVDTGKSYVVGFYQRGSTVMFCTTGLCRMAIIPWFMLTRLTSCLFGSDIIYMKSGYCMLSDKDRVPKTTGVFLWSGPLSNLFYVNLNTVWHTSEMIKLRQWCHTASSEFSLHIFLNPAGEETVFIVALTIYLKGALNQPSGLGK